MTVQSVLEPLQQSPGDTNQTNEANQRNELETEKGEVFE